MWTLRTTNANVCGSAHTAVVVWISRGNVETLNDLLDAEIRTWQAAQRDETTPVLVHDVRPTDHRRPDVGTTLRYLPDDIDPYAPWTLYFTTGRSTAPNAQGRLHYVELTETGYPATTYALCGRNKAAPIEIDGYDPHNPPDGLCSRCRQRVARHMERRTTTKEPANAGR